MKKKTFCYIVLLLFCINKLSAQQKLPYNTNDKKVNWGVKIGFNSAVPNANIQTEQGNLTSKTTNKVGYLIECFSRINVKKLFLQPEISYSTTKESIHFQGNDKSPLLNVVDININAFDVATVIGYNTVKQNECGLSLFAGIKGKYAYEINIKPSEIEKITETDPFYNLYLTTGVGINVSHLFFDLRYDFALFRNETSIQNSSSVSYNEIIIDKRSNILNFSVGFMF